ncbi:MAG: (2Fe-2S)-binding protein, partial [Acidimicrobiia bacterium]|nr:(2Fe-2S)-binding protein [Acidimicrobiia bacterium]
MIEQPIAPPRACIDLTVDGVDVSVPEESTLLDACDVAGVDDPTLCYLRTLDAINSCRACVVEVEGSRNLVPACSRLVEEGMVVESDSDRVQRIRKTVYELLASSVDLSLAEPETVRQMQRYDVDPERFGAGWRRTDTVKIEDDLYIRDYDKCIMCFRCVAACGPDAQNT